MEAESKAETAVHSGSGGRREIVERRTKCKPPTRSHRLRVPVTPAEKARIEGTAGAVNMAAAVYLRHVGLGQAPRAVADHGSIQELLHVAADVGRFGGLLKLWLTDDPKTDGFDRPRIRELVGATDETKAALSAAVRRALRGGHSRSAADGEPWHENPPLPKRATQLQVHVTPEEQASIQQAAGRRGLSVAAYLRDGGTRYRPARAVDSARMEEVLQVRQELNRSGWLLRSWLDNDPEFVRLPVSQLHRTITATLSDSRQRLDALQALAPQVVTDV